MKTTKRLGLDHHWLQQGLFQHPILLKTDLLRFLNIQLEKTAVKPRSQNVHQLEVLGKGILVLQTSDQ
jgi:hypothetical protein